MREKRQHQRAELSTDVDVSPQDGPTWITSCVDISLGGMFLLGEPLVPIGSEVTLNFEMPGLGRVVMPAFVRWSSARGFGVQFGLMGVRETHAIGRLVRAQPLAV